MSGTQAEQAALMSPLIEVVTTVPIGKKFDEPPKHKNVFIELTTPDEYDAKIKTLNKWNCTNLVINTYMNRLIIMRLKYHEDDESNTAKNVLDIIKLYALIRNLRKTAFWDIHQYHEQDIFETSKYIHSLAPKYDPGFKRIDVFELSKTMKVGEILNYLLDVYNNHDQKIYLDYHDLCRSAGLMRECIEKFDNPKKPNYWFC